MVRFGRDAYVPIASGRTAIETTAFKSADRLPSSPKHASMQSHASAAKRTPAVFDTLRFADRLKRSGFETPQAEGLARAIGDEVTTMVEHVVTKPDLDAAIASVRSDLAGVDARLSVKVDALATQVRFIMAILVVLLALGLVDTVPRILG